MQRKYEIHPHLELDLLRRPSYSKGLNTNLLLLSKRTLIATAIPIEYTLFVLTLKFVNFL